MIAVRILQPNPTSQAKPPEQPPRNHHACCKLSSPGSDRRSPPPTILDLDAHLDVIQIIRGFVVRLSQLPISARVEIPAEFDRPYQLLLSPNNATRESLAFGVDGGAELAAGGGGRGGGRVVDLVLFDGGEDGVAKFDLGGDYVFLN